MVLYVKAKPGVMFEGENSHGFYREGEDLGLTCNIKSYPINETIVEIMFLNCTKGDESSMSSKVEQNRLRSLLKGSSQLVFNWNQMNFQNFSCFISLILEIIF